MENVEQELQYFRETLAGYYNLNRRFKMPHYPLRIERYRLKIFETLRNKWKSKRIYLKTAQ